MPFRFEIPIEPRGKDRPRFRIVKTKKGQQFVNVYTTAATRNYELEITGAAVKAIGGSTPFEGPLTVTIDCIMPVPASWSQAKWHRAVTGIIRPASKPDWDNLAKSIIDACNGVIWRDDAQIVDCRVRKFYGKKPGILLSVRATEIGLLEPLEGGIEAEPVAPVRGAA